MAFSMSISKCNLQTQIQNTHWSKLSVAIKLDVFIMLELIAPVSSESSKFAQLIRLKPQTSLSN